jgi:hypothetical protein
MDKLPSPTPRRYDRNTIQNYKDTITGKKKNSKLQN